ncbi:uncharacterized protein LOC131007907 [Salvia miltiorrhiza]|uniref:uncharacterized protein LOC131007907 n=1 Tax=Salvia miltiorrhiza TaxID=226208 RepID=UPI0025AC6FDC|nr:uncharacterized protein LOC131007907 [Salvia miltiorrhiza]
MDCYYHPFTAFNLIRGDFRPPILPQLRIQFHFFFEIKYNNYLLDHDCTLQGFPGTFPTTQTYATATMVIDGETLSFAAVKAAVGRAIRNHVPTVGRRGEDLIVFAFEQARVRLPAHRTLSGYCDLHLTFDVRVEHRHVFFVEDEDPLLKPAAEEPSFAFLLEKYEEEEEEEERCCCICLEKLGDGGGASKMPCSHVYHGGCINKWLRKSPSCPLCRYEI